MYNLKIAEVAPFAWPVPPGLAFVDTIAAVDTMLQCKKVVPVAPSGGAVAPRCPLRFEGCYVWDSAVLPVWDIVIFAGVDDQRAWIGATEETVRAAYGCLEGRLDMVKPDGSKWRQRAPYDRVEVDYLRGRRRLCL